MTNLIKTKQTNTGRTHFKKGIIPWNKGTVGIMPPPTNKGVDNRKNYECVICFRRFKAYLPRKYCSVKCSALTKIGEGNPKWIGGSWLTVRKQLLIEQDYTCQECGLREPEIMEVNHKLERSRYPELSREKNNMEVLCPNCHRRKTNTFLKTNKHNQD